jgi:hypothetical protein
MPPNPAEICARMDSCWSTFAEARQYFPYIDPKLINVGPFEIAINVTGITHPVILSFPQGITAAERDKHQTVANWLNQNLVVRLYSILDHCGIVGDNTPINQSLPGWKAVDLVRRLRNVFGHTQGIYNSGDASHVKLVTEICTYAGQQIPNPTSFPLSIDTILTPLLRDCKEYVHALCKIGKT